jgi:2-dehydro-3-deoxygluconokinase
MAKVINFGEIMLRLAPHGYYRFTQADSFGVVYGGGEANVAVALANFGVDSAFVTKLPEHEIGQAAINTLRRYGVDTSNIVRGGERIGIYFLERGASQRPSKVIYDRANSSMAEAVKEDFAWSKIFDGADWFHFSGITPALGTNATEICIEACKYAKSKGITISCDINYRQKLWTIEQASNVMITLMGYVDVCIANEEHANTVLGVEPDNKTMVGTLLSADGYKEISRKLVDKFGFSKVALTLRSSTSATCNNVAAMLYDGQEYYFSKEYSINIVDRIGGGDSFTAGLIYGAISGMSSKDMLEFAVASGCLKHSVEGDFSLMSSEEVLELTRGDGSGRVQR